MEELHVSGVTQKIILPTIILTEASKVLESVTITGKVPYVERKIDRTVVNVDALISNAGSSALEALERSPGISVDQNGSLKLKGRSGVSVFIDDKPSYLSGAELENYLKSLPASSIKQIEIMTNPPAKYEAAGNSGIINIITRKNRSAGFHGNVVTNIQRGRYTRSNNSLNLHVNKSKISAYANINVGFRSSFQDLTINRYYKNEDLTPATSFSQNSFIVKSGQSINGKIGLDYYVNDKTTIGFSGKGIFNPSKNDTDNKAIVMSSENIIIKKVNADNVQNGSFNNGTFNVYLKQQLDTTGSNIVVDLDYVSYLSGNNQIFKNYIYQPNDVLDFNDQIMGNIPSDIKIYAAKADYTKPLNATSKFDAGLKTAYTKTDNEAAYSTTIDGITSTNYDLSNRFLYDEQIHAAYGNFSTNIGRVEFQAGLRAENTTLKGNQLGNPLKPASSFTRSYNNVFPTIYVSWNTDSTAHNNLSFTYGRRIDRPYFQDLNPFISPLDKFTFYGGNPNLLPTYAHNLSLAHSYKGTINTTINYSKTLNGINETLEIKDGIYYSRPGNIANNTTISLSIDAAIPVKKWYNINAYVELGNLSYKSQLYTEQLNSSGNYGYFSANNSFQLGRGWNADVRGEYQSDIVYAQLLIKSYRTLQFAFQKKMLKDAGSIKLSINDILYTRRSNGVINNLRLTDANWQSNLDTRSVSLTFSVRFGKSTSDKPKHTSTGSDTEQQRVKG
ncbi:MAG: outer membrane beta-barrel protein [Saprospiraceae bacterium]|nr:outer membrane beta-barrel protein [Saprospiraceae bacterium]